MREGIKLTEAEHYQEEERPSCALRYVGIAWLGLLLIASVGFGLAVM